MKNAGMKNAGLKKSGEAIEKVLAGLRDADAPVGMERRILDGLEERAAARSRSGWRWWLPVWLVAPARPVAVGSLVCGAALAGIFVVALGIPAIRRLGHAPLQVKGNAVPAGSLREANPEAAKRVRPVLSRPGLRSLRVTAEAGKTSAGSVEAGMARDWDSDSVALDEMHAASRPAPPMPLTEQERLLLRLVHKDDPVELAMLDSMLDSKLRALQDSEDKAEFQRFFGQSTKQVVPEQPVTESAAPQQSTTEQIAPGQSATEEATPAQPGTEQAVPKQTVPEQTTPEQAAPEQRVPEQPVPDQPTQQPSTPERSAPDQSTTQQATPRPTRTGDKE
jgi:hypothetical protein